MEISKDNLNPNAKDLLYVGVDRELYTHINNSIGELSATIRDSYPE